MTVPGVGPVAALSFKVGVDDPRRFGRSRTVGAHFGLAPRRHQFGTSIDYEGRISKQGDVAVREALCKAAASLLLRVRRSALRAWGLRIAKRSSMLCAITAVARKLAGILHRMWVSETDFHVGFGAKVSQRLRLKPVQYLLRKSRRTSAVVAPSMLRRSKDWRSARAERPLAGPRNGECPLSLACCRPLGTRASDCLDSPVYEPGEEHAKAQVPNAKERMDPACASWSRLW
jgi:hypothetical protein